MFGLLWNSNEIQWNKIQSKLYELEKKNFFLSLDTHCLPPGDDE